MPALCLFAALLVSAPPQLVNPGFEDGAKGWSLPAGFAVDPAVAHEGAASLRIENTDPAKYQLAAQTVGLQVGRQYRFGVWVKTENVVGEENGATVCIEWTGGGKWLGGAYPEGIKGTRDWVHVQGLTRPLPEQAETAQIKLYLRRGMTGKAWFDDLTLTEFLPPPLRIHLLRPTYRGRVVAGRDGGDAVVRVQIASQLAGDRKLADVRLTARLTDGDQVVRETTVRPREHEVRLTVPLGVLKAGRYALKLSLTDAAGEVLDSDERQIEALPAEFRPKVALDGHGRTMVDGQPFFPLGVYDGRSSADDLQRLAAAGFTCVMPYGINSADLAAPRELLDHAQAAGIKVIYSIKDFYEGLKYAPKKIGEWTEYEAMARGVVERFRDHPALLGWYLNDESPLTMHDRLRARYELVRELDPHHPTWIVLYQVDELAGYLDTTDVLGTDPYPLPKRPLAMAGQWAEKTLAAEGGAGSVWQVPQAFGWEEGVKYQDHHDKWHRPTLAQLRNMTFQQLAAGAKGLVFYSYSDMKRYPETFASRFADLAVVAGEVKALAPFLLSTDPATEQPTVSDPATVYAAAWRLGDQVLVMAANGGEQPAKVTWKLPAAPQVKSGAATRIAADGCDLQPGEAVAAVVRR